MTDPYEQATPSDPVESEIPPQPHASTEPERRRPQRRRVLFGVAAVLLAIVARYMHLTDEDLAILGPVMLVIAGVVIRTGVFSPSTVSGLLEGGDPRSS